ncbi:MAG: hypothetical protein KC419_19155 [Anaerolineales bacterium]|nr:hypothetical protein [Anaerolineales bacterium]MCA9930615.1 hypothetical protein [Anaerolineales bacterium]
MIYIGQVYIRQVLKRLREIGSESQDELHKKWMQFTYDTGNKLSFLNGMGLKLSIEKYMESTNDYINWKQKFIEEVGYEDGRYQMKVTFPSLSEDPKE